MKKTTVEQWLKTLPEPYKSKALMYAKKVGSLHNIEPSCDEAILGGFDWDDTQEKKYFWNNVRKALMNNKPLPPFPKQQVKKPTKSQRESSTYLTAIYLINHSKSYIHDLKKVTKANNPMQRIKALRETFNWNIKTVYEGTKQGVAIYHYKLVKKGRMPKQYK